jgi:hypothetical protein
LALEQFRNNERGAVRSWHDEATLDGVFGAEVDLRLDAVFNERLVDGGGVRTAVTQSLHGGRLREVDTVATSGGVGRIGSARNLGFL